MRILTAFIVFALLSVPTLTQQSVKCRPLTSNDFVGPNESIVGSGQDAQVCTVVKATTPPTSPTTALAPGAPSNPQPSTAPPTGTSNPQPVQKRDKPVVFLNGNGNTQTNAGRGLFGSSWATTSQHDQSLELAKDFEACPVTVSLKQENADYTVVLNHEGNNHNQMALTNTSGEIILSDNAHGLHQSVKNKSDKFCAAIVTDWNKKQAQPTVASKD
jgi:hypothetical protein